MFLFQIRMTHGTVLFEGKVRKQYVGWSRSITRLLSVEGCPLVTLSAMPLPSASRVDINIGDKVSVT